MKLLLIDNYDSFTFNLYQQIERLGGSVKVYKHDEIVLSQVQRFDAIVISPGPKNPKDARISCEVIRKYYKAKPILGVCLGHQCIAKVFGSKIVRTSKVMHGKTSSIFHTGTGIFSGVSNPFKAARYHSLIVNKVPQQFKLIAWTDNKIIMAVQHKIYPIFGVQFHPESFLTSGGDTLISNFLNGTY